MEKLFARLFPDNPDAAALCLLVFQWANDYDHLVDGDLPPAGREEALHRAMQTIALAVPCNPFYVKHRGELQVSLANAISTWRISTTLQRGDDPLGHSLAHVLRWIPIEFFLHCARIVGGEAWVQQAGPRFWVEMTRNHSFEHFARECGG